MDLKRPTQKDERMDRFLTGYMSNSSSKDFDCETSTISVVGSDEAITSNPGAT